MKLIQSAIATLVLCVTLPAQEPAATSPGTVGGAVQAAKVNSPEVLPGGRITFRLLAPKAAKVQVQGNWKGGRDLPMTRDDSGLWSLIGIGGGGHLPTPATPPCVRIRTRRFESVTLTLFEQ